MAVEIQRNEYGHDRHFPPNYGVVPPVPMEGENKEDGDNDRDDAAQSQLVATSGQNDRSPRRQRNPKISSEGALIHNDDDDKLAYGIWAPPYASE